MEGSKRKRIWQREIYSKRKLEGEKEGGMGEYVMRERWVFSDCTASVE